MNAHGGGKVIRSPCARKQEKNLDDYRVLTTIYRTITTKGDQVPNIFLMKGKKKKVCSERFLMKHGATCSLEVVMTETVPVTTEA